MGSVRQHFNNFADRLFTGYANLVVRFTALVGGLGVLLAVAFALGLLVTDVDKRNVNELWTDLDSRLVDEMKEFERYYGGLTRKLTSVVSSASSEGVLFNISDNDAPVGATGNGMAALQESMAVWANVTFTYDNNVYSYNDVCERPVVPVPFRRSQSSADLYWRFAQCMQADSGFTRYIYPTARLQFPTLPAAYTPVEEGWGIDEFPCSRASALDCFREGQEVDWPSALRELGDIAFPLATAVNSTYTTVHNQIANTPVEVPGLPPLTVSQLVLSGQLVPCWFASSTGNVDCLEPRTNVSNQAELVTAVTLALRSLIAPTIGVLDLFDTSGRLRMAVTTPLVANVIDFLPATTNQTDVELLAEQATRILLTSVGMAAGNDPVLAPLLLYLDFNRAVDGGTVGNTTIGATCLSVAALAQAGVAPSADPALQVRALIIELVGAAQFFSSIGFYWRPSYKTMTPGQIVEHINDAANSQLNPAVRGSRTACIFGQVKCCQAWNGAFLGTSIYSSGIARPQRQNVSGTGFSSLSLSAITLIRSGWEDYHHNNPVWQDQLEERYPSVSWTSEERREDLARAFDQKLTDDWLRLYQREAGTGYGAGEMFSALRFDFATGNSLTDILEQAGSVEGSLLGLSYGVMAVLVFISLGNYGTALLKIGNREELELAMVNSHGILGLFGLATIAISSAAGIGFASYVQVTLNGISVNLAPFVSLGLGIDDMFVLAHTMTALNDRSRSVKDNMGAVMRLAGPSVCLTSVANAAAFILIYPVPIAAVRQLVLVLMISVLINLLFLFLIFVPLMVYDMRRNHANRMDVIFTKASKANKSSTPEEANTMMARFIDKVYAPLLSNTIAKIVIVLLFTAFCAVMLWNGIVNTEQGLRTSDIALRDTYQRDLARLTETTITIQKSNLLFIARDRQFSDVNAQQRMLDLLDALEPSPHIVQGTRLHDLNFLSNSTASILAFYNLQQQALAQFDCPDANVNVPINSTFCYNFFFPIWFARIGTLLTPYLYCQHHATGERVPCMHRDAVLTVARTNYYFDNLVEHQTYLDAITDVRSRVDPFNNNDIRTFSIGYIFYFWEQYFDIEITLISAIGYGLLGVFVITFLFQLNPWLSIIVCFIILMIDIQLIGLMRPMDVKLNAISIANLVISIGMAVEFTAHYARAFLLAQGSRNQRMKIALHEMLQPMINGALSTIIALSVLSANQFPFFRRYYALTYVVMVLVAFANGLILLPVVLSLVGPPAREVDDKSGTYRMNELNNGGESQNGTMKKPIEAAATEEKTTELA
ncbi:protein patched homolog 1-like [Sycon ciliatum]|uniref:protein patched homolog 1-like n=1 Tax=Sycon ciliatum TaxID=27933 RepID=UPI0031F68B85